MNNTQLNKLNHVYKTKAAAEYRTQRLSRQTKIIEVEATYKYANN